MAENDLRKIRFREESFVIFPQQVDEEKSIRCSEYGAARMQMPIFADYWCESLRNDRNWCRHNNYPYASLELILSGRVEYISEGSKYEAAAGDLFVFTHGQNCWYIHKERTHKIFLIIDGTMFKLLMAELGFMEDTLIHLEDPAETENQLRLIHEEMEKHSEQGRYRASGLLWTLLLDLSGQLKKTDFINNIPQKLQSQRASLSKGNMTYWKNDEIAKLFGVSKRTLYNIFRKYWKDSPHQWQRRQQLERAALLLSSTEKSVTAIAAECGFENSKYFITLFKKIYGVPPGQWRNDSKNTPPAP